MITLQSQIGMPLTPAQADGNIQDLDARLSAIESKGLLATGIASITYDPVACTLLLTLSDNSTYGPLNLPLSMFQPRGEWQTQQAYRLRDYVSYLGSSYVALADHTAGLTIDADITAGKWMVVSKRGNDFVNFRGMFDFKTQYAYGDGVFFSPNGGAYVLYRLMFAAPVGTFPGALVPGLPVTYWVPLSTVPPTTEHGLYFQGTFIASQLFYRRRIVRAQTLPANLNGAAAQLATAPAADYVISIQKNGGPIGTITFKAGSAVGVISVPSTVLGVYDILSFVGSATADTKAAGLDLVVIATLN